ncbi:DUF4129 domain-containing protein [Methylomonas sp. LW13]|uniref:DUF4129 domain-containing protein n=1 Tax=unclassified Methylomonas TaxID=2608980 RepID=UPI00051B34F5|nr:DUF4129 domain-containing protein [Methylomonas sp. LW13]QBC29666.1 DUF4129 domain-containing protein [Methylomonas sp. LW13]
MRFAALLLLCLAGSSQAQDNSLQACLNLARQQSGQQLDIKKHCPALFKELANQGLLTSFDPPLTADVSATQLALLADSLNNSGTIRQEGLTLLLAEILITPTDDSQANWWQAVLNWLNSLKPADHEDQYQQLQRWLAALKPSQQAAEIIIYVSIALLLGLSAWLVISELYQAGVFRKFSGKRQPVTPADKLAETQSLASHPTIKTVTPQAQIGALLAQLINALIQRQLLPADPSLTHRQLVSHFQQQARQADSAFSRLVRQAEPLLYGHRPVDADLVGNYRREVQALLGNLRS